MSHSTATFIFSDGVTYYGEYNGTSDVLLPRMFKTRRERDLHWRSQDTEQKCTCDSMPEDCVVHTYYGPGFYWYGKACRICMVFITPLSLDEIENYEISNNIPEVSKLDFPSSKK